MSSPNTFSTKATIDPASANTWVLDRGQGPSDIGARKSWLMENPPLSARSIRSDDVFASAALPDDFRVAVAGASAP